MKAVKDKRLNEIKKTEGFTLIEVIVAIAIVSIVAAAIMQMFTISARTNSKAYSMDKANALSVETAERFKADPGFAAAAGSGFNSTTTDSGIIYSQYLDRNFGSASPAQTSNSAYRLDLRITTASAITTSKYYYPDPAFSYQLRDGDMELESRPGGTKAEIGLYLRPDGSVCNVGINRNGDWPIDTAKIILSDGTQVTDGTIFSFTNSTAIGTAITTATALIPIMLDCSALQTMFPDVNGDNTINIKVENGVGTVVDTANGKEYSVVVDVYFCNAPPGTTVTVDSVEGAVAGQSRPVSTSAKTENVMYTAKISIVKLPDNSVIVKNTAKKYWVD